MAETGSKPGAGKGSNEVLQLSIERKRKNIRDAPDDESRLRVLFRELGGEGKVRIKRKLPGDLQYGYLGTLDASNTVCDELEETIAGTYGGGDYQITGREKGEDLGSVYIRIDPRQFPPRFPDQAPGPAASSAAPPALQEQLRPLLDQMERDRARMERMAEQRATDMQGFTTAIVAAMNTGAAERARAHEANTQILVAALTGSKANAPAAVEPMKQLEGALTIVEKVNAITGKGSDDRSTVERVLEEPLKVAATHMVNKMWDHQKEQAATASSAPAAPTPAPIATPAPTPPPRAAGVAKPPAGWTPITKEQLDEAKARARAATKATVHTPPAPAARQVLPEKP